MLCRHVIPVVLDGLPLSFDVPPLIIEGRTFVPFRAIAEALQVEVAWHEERCWLSEGHRGKVKDRQPKGLHKWPS